MSQFDSSNTDEICKAIAQKLMYDEKFQAELMEMLDNEENKLESDRLKKSRQPTVACIDPAPYLLLFANIFVFLGTVRVFGDSILISCSGTTGTTLDTTLVRLPFAFPTPGMADYDNRWRAPVS